jgi:uncharacterized membrane protein
MENASLTKSAFVPIITHVMKHIPFRLYIFIAVLVALWCIGILAAPLLKCWGYSSSADAVYSFFSRTCHQSDVRSFHVEGEKFGVCIRCSAIYFGFLAGLLFMPLFGVFKRTCIPNAMLLFAVVLPMFVDVVLNDIGFHASTTISRVATGALFGVVMPWCVVPLIIEACLQIIQRKKIFH